MKLIILDRDGVINEDSDEYIKSETVCFPLSVSFTNLPNELYFGPKSK